VGHPANQTAVVRTGAIDLAESARARFGAESLAHKYADGLITYMQRLKSQ
jgi:hypothetical protein